MQKPRKRLLLALLLLPAIHAISLSARRVQTSFILLTNTTTCPPSITHTKIATFRDINPSAPEQQFDGLLWDTLLINGSACQMTLESRLQQSTYFLPTPTSPPGVPVDEAQPFFLQGRDNSPRRCITFTANLPGSYLFTDDLPSFRERFQREGLIDPGVEEAPVRGVVYMFLVPISGTGEVVERACAYVEVDDVVPVSPDADVPDMPACFPAGELVSTPGGSVPMHALEIGDLVYTRQGVERVLSFTHKDKTTWQGFVKILTNGSVTLSSDHLLPVNGRMTAAGLVRRGDLLESSRGPVKVRRVDRVLRRGLFAPVTASGELMVGDVVVSCYTVAVGETVGHALLAPVRGAALIAQWTWDVCPIVDYFRDILWSR